MEDPNDDERRTIIIVGAGHGMTGAAGLAFETMRIMDEAPLSIPLMSTPKREALAEPLPYLATSDRNARRLARKHKRRVKL